MNLVTNNFVVISMKRIPGLRSHEAIGENGKRQWLKVLEGQKVGCYENQVAINGASLLPE